MTAIAAEAARRQGQFWLMYQAINRSSRSTLDISLGLHYHQFLADLDDEELHHRIEADRREGQQLGVMTTPTFFVDRQRFYGKLTQSYLAPIIHAQVSQYAQPVLSKMDIANGMIYWDGVNEYAKIDYSPAGNPSIRISFGRSRINRKSFANAQFIHPVLQRCWFQVE